MTLPPASRDTPVVPDAAIVSMEGASRTFDDVVALDGVSLSVGPGTILGLIGPSGAGKTTSLRLLTGALAPTAGTVRVLGGDPARLSLRARRRIGYMPQLPTLLPDLTASENIDLAASLIGMLYRPRRRRVAETLELLDLTDARGRLTRHLSGGMQRRVALASALVHEPELLFLDEPTAGIDPILRVRIWDELRRLRDRDRTLLVTTQYVSEAEWCDRVAVIANGRLIAHGTPDELRRQAIGGDVVEIETATTFDGERLGGLEGVRSVDQVGLRSVRIVVDDAGTATPAIGAEVADAGIELVSSREWRPTYDEIFAILVRDAAAEPPGGPSTGPASGPSRVRAPEATDGPADDRAAEAAR